MQRTDTILHIGHFSNLEKWSANISVFEGLKSSFPLAPLSKVLKRVKEPVNIEDDKKYKRITVRLYGQGVLQRDELLGREIGTKRQFIARAGQLIISRIDARNGAFGIVPDELEGAIVTNDFWLFEVKNALPQYLILLLASDLFQQHWQSKSSGTTNRQRVDEESFISSKILLPDLDRQREIAGEYYDQEAKANILCNDADKKEREIFSLWDAALEIDSISESEQQLFSAVHYSELIDWAVATSPLLSYRSTKFKSVPVCKLCQVNSGGTPSRSNMAYFTGNIPWVKTAEVMDCEIEDTEEKITEEAIRDSSARIYSPGCIIIAMYGQTRGQTAKLMIPAATNQACAVLHNIDNSKVLTDFLWLYMQGQYHRIRKLAVGSAQPNLNAQMIKDYPVVLPPIHSTVDGEVSQELLVKIVQQKRGEITKLRQEAKRIRQHAKESFEEAVFGAV